MAYAGIQTMLLAYKMRKSDKDFELMGINDKLLAATKDSGSLQKFYDRKLAELNQDDPNYKVQSQEINQEMDASLAEVASWEDELQQTQSNAEAEIALLDGYIETWTSALQNGIQKSHTFGAVE